MNKNLLAQAVRKAVKPKFGRRKYLKSKVVAHYPENMEREYARITNAYMTLLNKTLAEYLPKIRKAIDAKRAMLRLDELDPGEVFAPTDSATALNIGIRFDAEGDDDDDGSDNFDEIANLEAYITELFMKIQREFEEKAIRFGLGKRLETLGKQALATTLQEWKRTVRRTLGINILEDYYKGEFYRHNLRLWTEQNTAKIKAVPNNTMNLMRGIILNGYLEGKTNTTIGEEIRNTYKVERRRARFIARDQIAKLNSDITEAQQRDAGVQSFVWSSSADERVRDCHNDFDGHRYDWDDLPDDYYYTKAGRVYTGHNYAPGKAPNCRCVALPVFDIEKVVLPWEGANKDDGRQNSGTVSPETTGTA